MISKETIDRIFAATRVEEVIGDFVQLKRSGSNLKGLSPFSDEKTPSFMVSPAKQIWKDFSSGKGGNAVSFLMELEHMSYPEALRHLAEKYNIEIEEAERSPEQIAEANARESMYLVSEFAQKWFEQQMLESPRGRSIGLGYFKERGFRDDIIKKFSLGYSPDEWTAFTDAALQKGYKQEYLERTGLTIVKGEKKFDRFKGRVMFPIHTYSGRVAGFGGRTLLTEKKVAKYLNSPESEIYHKSDILYGLYQSKQAIIKYDMCYLVEGYTDVISMHQAGIENVVASSGTALTKGQIQLIKRLTTNITVLYDGDAAGIRASFRGIDLLLEQDMNIRVLTFPDGDDPDSFARKTPDDELKSYLKEENKDFITFKTSLLMEDAKGDPIRRAELIREIVKSISKLTNRIKREVYVKECSAQLGISEEVLFNELAQIDRSAEEKANKQLMRERRQENLQRQNQAQQQQQELHPDQAPMQVVPNTPTPDAPQQSKYQEQESALMLMLLNYGDLQIEVEDSLEYENEEGEFVYNKETISTTITQYIVDSLSADDLQFENTVYQSMYQEILDGLEEGELRVAKYFSLHRNQDFVQVTIDLISDKHPLSDWQKKGVFMISREQLAHKYVAESLLRFKEKRVKSMLEEISKHLDHNNQENYRADMERIKKLIELRSKLNQELRRPV